MEATYKGTNKMLTGIVFGVITFWLFAQAMVNVVPAIQSDLGVSLDMLNVAISLAALFSGVFIVAAGGIADKIGRKKVANIGLGMSIIGSLLIVLATDATLLIVGRAIQGVSAACIMPSTIALIKAYYEGADRQRALSYWSIGSWGGSGVCSFAGGAIATYLGWKWIYIISIGFALVGIFLLKDTPESKMEQTGSTKFDIKGFITFIIVTLALNLVVTRGNTMGWTSVPTLSLIGITVAGMFAFFKIENGKVNAFIDFSLFKNKPYTGAVLSNFLLNAVAGTLVVANTYIQVGRGFNAFQAGMLSLGYLVAVLGMIRVGEKILQRTGARKPMIIGSLISALGIGMMAMTFLTGLAYTVTVFVGFMLFGIGLGVYATPSTDTAVSNAPADKIGTASGVYKMASSLGGSFGVALSTTIYGAAASVSDINTAATIGLLTNVIFAILAVLATMATVPERQVREIHVSKALATETN